MELFSIKKFLLITIGLLMTSQVFALDSLRTEKSGDQYFVIHRVEKGETLYSLARRYGAELSEVVSANNIENNQIALFQEIRIPIVKPTGHELVEEPKMVSKPKTSAMHVVEAGQTLYAISRLYNVAVDDLKKWNNLTSNELSIGQEIIVGETDIKKPEPSDTEKTDRIEIVTEEEPKEQLPEGFQLYFVQSGELLETIAAKFNVRPDSIVIWNDLPNTYLSIGQRLLVKGSVDEQVLTRMADVESLPYGKRKKVKDASGFIKIIEEGMARKIDDVDTKKYLVMHRDLPIGTLLEVRNLMNNQKIFARVVGKLPETGLNENVLVRLTPICFERLGVIDPQTRVEVSYYED